MASLEDLRKKILDAFNEVPYPGDDNIVAPGSFGLERQALARHFKGRPWQSLRLADVHNTSGSMLTPAAFHYYFPAYMTAVLEDFDKSDVLPEYTLFWLDPERHNQESEVNEFKSRLNSLQKSIIVDYLRYLKSILDTYAAAGTDYGGYAQIAERLIKFYRETDPH